MVSAFKTKDVFKLFNMCIPEKTDYSLENLRSTIYRLPLVLASSIQKNSSEDQEDNLEYAIPQMLTDLIKQENRRLAESRIQKSYDLDTIWGIIFTSSKIANSQSSDKIRFKNIVLPVIETKGDTCSYIASLFSISEPYLIQGTDMYDGDAMAGFERMHRFEEKLTSREFTEIKYLLVNSYNEVIELDQQGHPVTVEVKSNCEWKIKEKNQQEHILHALAFPNREKPVPRVTKDTDPDAVQRRRLDVNAQRNNQKHLNAIEDAAFSMLTELEQIDAMELLEPK